jgi:hypothetical protein
VKVEQIRTIAKSRGVHPGKLSKAELIKLIQAAEGNVECFSTAVNGECDQVSCLWREDCFDAARRGVVP